MKLPMTANELTWSHGVSPADTPQFIPPEIRRGFLIYIRLETKADPGKPDRPYLRIRQFFYDYDEKIKSADEFIDAVARIAPDDEHDEQYDAGKYPGFSRAYVGKNAADRQPFPYIFAEHFNEVNFGWKPCDVIFMLDNRYFSFLPSPGPENPDSLLQPVVFRKNKAIRDQSGYHVERYEPNFSFYNLKSKQVGDISTLKFQNYMTLDSKGTSIGCPDPGKVWHYCMDIYLDVPQDRKAAIFGISEVAAKNLADGPTNWLTIVFDPPNNNGGNGGPP